MKTEIPMRVKLMGFFFFEILSIIAPCSNHFFPVISREDHLAPLCTLTGFHIVHK